MSFKLKTMIKLNRIHHVAIICSDIEKSKSFYTCILGCAIIREVYRANKDSYKIDLTLNNEYIIELFSFPLPPHRLTKPEAVGLRHLAFEIDDLDSTKKILLEKGIFVEPLRFDEYTGKRFTFIFDPDNLPIELYEKSAYS